MSRVLLKFHAEIKHWPWLCNHDKRRFLSLFFAKVFAGRYERYGDMTYCSPICHMTLQGKKIISVRQINLFITKYWVVQLAVVMLFGFLMLFAYLYFWQYTFAIVYCTQSVIHLLGNRLFSYVTRGQKNRPGWHELKVLHHRKVMNTRWFSLVMRRVFPESSNSLSVSCSSKSPADRIAQNTLELKQEDSTIPFGPCL